jgi:hypothetical protein
VSATIVFDVAQRDVALRGDRGWCLPSAGAHRGDDSTGALVSRKPVDNFFA